MNQHIANQFNVEQDATRHAALNSATSISLPCLAAILISLALVIAPHANHLPAWIPAFGALVLLARFYLGYRRQPLPGRWLLLAAALAAIAGVAVSYRTLYGRDVGVAVLAVMAALKLMEMSRPRDSMVVVLLAYFMVITNFFYSQTIPTALYMLFVVWLITATMIALQYQSGPPRPLPVLRQSAGLMLQAVPLLLILFLLFPRVQGPLWGLPQVNYSARTGLSDFMSPGDVSMLSLSDGVAFRVRFETPPERPSQLYWRGPVMSEFDGRTWRAGSVFTAPSLQVQALSSPLRYSVTLEPHDRRWLFAIDLPTVVPASAFVTTDFQLHSRRLVRERLRYDMESVLSYRAGANERGFELRAALRLPDESAPRTRALAQRWREQSLTPSEIVQRGLTMFREQPFVYTLEPPMLGEEPVDEFLFETRSGFCEHYASAFAVLMRAAGIPSRVVTGYLGGEINPMDGYLVVRQSEAHAWTEIWLADEGWIRVDPTAAVSPLRIESGLAASVPETDPVSVFTRPDMQWLRQMRYTWDAVSNTWNQWVLGYTSERQTRFLSQLGMNNVTWQTLAITLMVSSGIILGLLALILLLRLATRRLDPVQRAYQRYCERMARLGAPRRPGEGPRDFTTRVSLQFPELRLQVQRIGALYVALRYGGEQDPRVLEEFRRAVSDLG